MQLSIVTFGLDSIPQEIPQNAVLEARVKELETELALYKKCKHCTNGNTEKMFSKVNLKNINFDHFIK